jgi:hypothetical protein
MVPPKVIKFREVRRIFATFGISMVRGRRHWCLVSGDGNKYPIPAHSDDDDVFRTYVEGARRKFGLTPQDGVSHKEFYGR